METFVIITWPEIQEFMEIDGFDDNACLVNDVPFISQYGSLAYFVRVSWLEKYI